MGFARGASILLILLAALLGIIVWSGVGRRLERWRISAPVFMVVIGLAAGLMLGSGFGSQLNTAEAEQIVEVILAVLLFLDATEVRGGFFAGERGIVVRLLAIAFPLSLALAVLLGFVLLDASSWPVLLAIACVVMPIDFAPAARLLRARTVRRGVRHALLVESGYNDGIASPLFALALLLAAGAAGAATPADIPRVALLGAGVAVLVGAAMGALVALVARIGTDRGWATSAGLRVAMVIVPIVTYELASHLQGNGFIAAFLAGITYRLIRGGSRPGIPHGELTTLEDVAAILSMTMWAVLGAVAVLAFESLPAWTWIVYALLALTLIRMVPVWIATLGSALTWRERTTLGLYGPRGTSTIVFALLAFNALREDDANMTLTVATIVVFLSVILHSVVLGGRVADESVAQER